MEQHVVAGFSPRPRNAERTRAKARDYMLDPTFRLCKQKVGEKRGTSLTNAIGGDRANQVLPNGYAEKKTVDQWFNRAAFATSADGEFGNLRVNTLFGPGSIRIDMGLTRAFQFREKQSFEFRAEAFNIPNHVNLNNPASTALSDAQFGKITTVGDPRILQFALKYLF